MGQPLCAGAFDTVVSRAAFKLPELVRMASFFLRTGGVLIAQKGPDPREEMEKAKDALGPLGMSCAACRDVTLPIENSQRKIVVYKRISR
jgi:16S rRNA (guanine527-N7)-methyltransferase